MSYQINKTDGTVVATVADGQIDNLSTDLTLIGKNYSGFGESLNENFVKLLENFSNTTQPTHPIKGQIWFDSSELKLKVYSGSQFIPVSSATISGTQPTTLGVGDLWFNSVNEQLFFFDGDAPILLGPSYSTSQGLSGLKVVSLLDTLNQTRVITLLYNNGILLGIFAKDSFTPKAAIEGFTGNIIPGFNAGNLSGLKFNVTCTNSDKLGGLAASTYVLNNNASGTESIAGTLAILSNTGLEVGSGGQAKFRIETGNILLQNTATDRDINVSVRKDTDQELAIEIKAATRQIGLYEDYAASQVNVGGNLVVGGNLTVSGTTTTVNSTVLEVVDKNIVLASGNNSDVSAREGGVILQGATKHIFMYADTDVPAVPGSGLPDLSGVSDEGAWNSSEHINLATGKAFYIDGVEVLNGSSLGFGITNIPGVNSFGVLVELEVGPNSLTPNINITANTISTAQPNMSLVLAPNGTGSVNVSSKKITGLPNGEGDAYLAYSAVTDAASVGYVNYAIESNTIVFSMDLTDGKNNTYIRTQILNNLVPPAEHREGTRARILCTVLNVASTSINLGPTFTAGAGYTLGGPFDVTGGGSAPAVTAISVGSVTVPSPGVTTSREIRRFVILSGVWTDDGAATPLP
jgi:hypothetical protein